MQYVVYPAVISFGGWVYKKWLIGDVEKEKAENDKKKSALQKSIDEAKDDDQILTLSIILRDYDKL